MEHILVKAATTAADQGIFEAVISTASEDRDGDIVEPSALVQALAKWADIGKLVPLAYSHKDPATGQSVVVGHMEPATARVDGNRVIVKGFVDQSTDRGAETWRLVKSGTLSFSYGYLVPDGGATKRAGKKTGYHITKLDLYEISVVPVGPANNETLVLDYKTANDLKRASARLERELADDQIGAAVADLATVTPPEPPPTVDDVLELLKALPDDQLDAVRAALPAAEPPPTPPDTEAQRKRSHQIEREIAEERVPEVPKIKGPPNPVVEAFAKVAPEDVTAEKIASTLDTLHLKADDQDVHLYVRVITADELEGVKSGEVKAVWSTAYVNNLPDSAFLHIESGGSKDGEGKTTPRSLRHFPVKDADGKVDLPHLRNALARIPQSSLSQAVKDRCVATAQRMLDATKSVDVTDKEPSARSVDPLRKRSEELSLEIASGGMSLRTPPTQVKKTTTEPASPGELKQRSRDLMFEVLSYQTE